MDFSVSALIQYWECPERYRKIYVSKEVKRDKQNVPMFVGSAVHAGIDALIRSKMSGEQKCLLDGLAAVEMYITKKIDDLEQSPSDSIIGSSDVIASVRNTACSIVSIYNSTWLQKIKPIASEMKFSIPWGNEDKIRGSIDLVEDAGNGEVCIVDHKISVSKTKAPDEDSAETNTQIKVYALVYKLITGKTPRIAALDHFVRSPKRPHFLRRSIALTEQMLRAAEMRVNRTIEAIKAGVFPPGDPVIRCKENRCFIYNSCPMGGGENGANSR